jgi:hypothetical protein
MNRSVAIIGGGPAGLMAAEVLIRGGAQVDVYDAMASLGRKFLMAGKSGLNITHSEPYEKFITHYGKRQKEIETFLKDFTPDDLRAWAKELGVETFVGTSGRVFPREMKASPLLRAWTKRLLNAGVNFHMRHKWLGWEKDSLLFESPDGKIKVKADAVVLALGGASWPKLGSSAEWVEWLEQAKVRVEAFRPSNCGFNVAWSKFFREKFAGYPIKSVILSFEDFKQQGEFVVTKHGVEGSLIYAASARLRDEIELHGKAIMHLDLVPAFSQKQIAEKLSKPRGSRSLSSHLEKTIGIKGVKAGLLREFLPKEIFADAEKLSAAIKDLQVSLISARPIAEAISSAGGVNFDELDSHLMLKKIPGVFCAGEMLDWEAPTGGYLLTACFATGRAAGVGVLEYIKELTAKNAKDAKF